MLKLGFAVNSLAPSQLSYYLVREVNRFLGQSKNASTDIVIFYQDIFAPRQMPICATMHINEIWGFDGVLIPTSVSTALKSVRVPGPQRKIFYPYTLEWIRPQQTVYSSFVNAYTSSNLEIIGRNIDHAQVIENCFNRKCIGHVEDFSIDQFMEAICQKR
jgi:hypothetical protein